MQCTVGASFILTIFILIGTINTFHPWNIWAMVSDYYSFSNNPWLYILGYISIGFAVRGILVYGKLKKKPEEVMPGVKSVK